MSEQAKSDQQEENSGRRKFIKDILKLGAGTAAVAVAPSILASCKKKNDDVEPLSPDNKSSVTVAKDAIYYGLFDGNDQYGVPLSDGSGKRHPAVTEEDYKVLKTAISGYPGSAIIEPGTVLPKTLKNAMPYASLTGINKDAVDNPYNVDPDIKQLFKDVQAIDGFLKAPAAKGGGIQKWQSPSIYMVDLRKPEAYNLMRDYMIKKATQYPQGLKLDDMDSATFLEVVTRDPSLVTDKGSMFYIDPSKVTDAYKSQFNGYTDAALKLMADVGQTVSAMPRNGVNKDGTPAKKIVVVNGGFQPHWDGSNKVFDTVARIPNVQVEKESFFKTPKTDATGKVVDIIDQDAGSLTWLCGRIYGRDQNGNAIDLGKDSKGNQIAYTNTLVQAFKDAGKQSIPFIAYEPALSGTSRDAESVMGGLRSSFQKLGDDVQAKENVGLQTTLFAGDRAINKPNDVVANAALRSTYNARIAAK
jgi:hypothetical protein